MTRPGNSDQVESLAAARRRNRESASDDPSATVRRLIDQHALILIGDKVVVLMEAPDQGGRIEPRFLSVETFCEWYRDERVQIGEQRVKAADLWRASPDKRKYLGVTFAPEGAPASHYNLWRGFAVEPALARCDSAFSYFMEHMRENVCGGDGDLFEWVAGWIAHLVQRPHQKLGTSLVLRGAQGVGKTKVGQVIGSLFGPHYVHVASPRYITGRFNSHLANCLVLHADEGFWAGDRESEGVLKDLITGESLWIERKGIEPFPVRNLVNLIVTSNERWVVPAGMEERRFCVLDVGQGRIQDAPFFAKMDTQLNGGGREALMRYLMDFPLEDVDLRRIPDTPGLEEQKVRSLDPEVSWWLDALRAGAVDNDGGGWPSRIACGDLYKSYLAQAERLGARRRLSEAELGYALRRLAPDLRR